MEQEGNLVLTKSYLGEGAYKHEAWPETAIMQQFRVSTYLNACIQSGFVIERVVEEVSLSDEDIEKHAKGWYNAEKAAAVPTTLILKCRKAQA